MLKNEQFVEYLEKLFPNATCELNYNNAFELLIAVILSAQCTDKRVNEVTNKLFNELKTPKDFVNVSIQELEQKIHSCGLYKSKAKHIKECCLVLVEEHNSQVPEEFEKLTKLSGVGRKTANVVCATCFGKNCIAVDTHVLRVSNRLGFTKSKNPKICEKDLVKKFKTNLNKLHHRMVLFGRYYCKAIKPECKTCHLKEECIYYKRTI